MMMPKTGDHIFLFFVSQDDVEMEDDANTFIEDQADVDQLTEEEFLKRKEAEFKRRSQAIQRTLPRPLDMNEAVLRPLNSNPPLTGK